MRPMRLSRLLIIAVVCTSCASANTDGSEPAKPVKEIVSGGARIRGGGIRMDVQVGRAFTQKPIKNATTTAKANAVVTP
jgi:hypothetical protein